MFRALLARAAELRLGDFRVPGFPNIAYALAMAGQRDTPLFAALAVLAERHLCGFNVRGFANTAWLFAKASAQVAARRRLGDLSVSDLAKKRVGVHNGTLAR